MSKREIRALEDIYDLMQEEKSSYPDFWNPTDDERGVVYLMRVEDIREVEGKDGVPRKFIEVEVLAVKGPGVLKVGEHYTLPNHGNLIKKLEEGDFLRIGAKFAVAFWGKGKAKAGFEFYRYRVFDVNTKEEIKIPYQSRMG